MSKSALDRVIEANRKRVSLELPAGAVQLLYDVLGHFPHKPGSWSNDARALCAIALMDARDSTPRDEREAVSTHSERTA